MLSATSYLSGQTGCTPLSNKRYTKNGAKAAASCELTIGVFWIIKNICNLNRFAFQQNAAYYTAAPRFK